MGLFDKFKGIKAENFRDSYQEPITEGQKAVGSFEAKLAHDAGKNTDHGRALKKLSGAIENAEKELAEAKASKADNAAELVSKAETSLADAQAAQRGFLTGERKVELTPKAAKPKRKPAAEAAKPEQKPAVEVAKKEVSVSDGLKKSFAEAETAAAKVTDPASSYFGIVRTQKDGWTKAVKANGEKMKFWSSDIEGFAARGKAFAHGSAVVGSVIGMGDAILRSKNSEGEDRSAMMRMAEFVVAGGVGAAMLVGGRAVAR